MSNTLFPIFLKTEHLRFLIVGGGNVGLEKAETLLRQNPNIKIKVVSKNFGEKFKDLLNDHPHIQYFEKDFEEADINDIDIVIAATDDKVLHQKIKYISNSKNILVNAADQPDLCDFYLGSIIKKGNLKIAVSTNGKSPTIAKRLREVLDGTIPEEIDDILNNLEHLRTHLSGDFKNKLEVLNKITKILSDHPENIESYLAYISQQEQ
ncbi:bifunctional precorrin-2 dehydrogenase/sirohydrochlorin ferrochelatase [Chryseobacterium sp. SIMBA_029]|uniref:precorrin-2 dehydrogenase/sirohydrochlorin ferrochelatase family protein n=1 Tax=Chryseobacterium sp. SIMBA_029 TaxID=3085772 RepID=UPI00397E6F67